MRSFRYILFYIAVVRAPYREEKRRSPLLVQCDDSALAIPVVEDCFTLVFFFERLKRK